MKKTIFLGLIMSVLLIGCESVSPLRYGEKTYTPNMSVAEMQKREQEIENIEQRARAQTREEMMDTAEAIKKARGDQTIIFH
jgi:ribosomal protein S7